MTASVGSVAPREKLGWGKRFGLLSVATLLAASLDTLLICATYFDYIRTIVFVLLHLVLAVAVGSATSRLLADQTHAVLLACGLAVMGPFGAAGALVVALADRSSTAGHPELEDWYRRLSGEAERNASEILQADILEGRAYRPSRVGVDNFGRILAHGTVSERQAVLGLLVQHDEQGSLDLMTTALRSPDVAVRASAAAAVARMRETAARTVPTREAVR